MAVFMCPLKFCPLILCVAKYNLEAAAVLGQSFYFSDIVILTVTSAGHCVITLSLHLISTPVFNAKCCYHPVRRMFVSLCFSVISADLILPLVPQTGCFIYSTISTFSAAQYSDIQYI